MPKFHPFQQHFGGRKINGSDRNELIFGSFGRDHISGNGGDDLIFGLSGKDKLFGGAGNDVLFGGSGRDTVEGGDGEDLVYGGRGNDVVVGNKGDDQMFGGAGKDLLVWNNGDGSDLIDGGRGRDRQQVNFDTDLVNDDLQNDDVAEFSVTDTGVQFARIALNGQTERGLFQLDIRNTEVQETNFGDGDDTAVIVGTVLDEIKLDLDGGDGVDLLDFSQAASPVIVNLQHGTIETKNGQGQDGTAVNFENVIGSEGDDDITGDDQNNVISGLGGIDTIFGKGGDDVLVANKGNDFVFGGYGEDLIVWNNGDGSDLFDGGKGEDTVQVNFDTDLVNDDLQNKDVAEFSTTADGVQFARIEVNDQTVNGLFQLDIRKTETLETNFGDGDDRAVIVGDVLDNIVLDLDGGDGIDTLDLSQVDVQPLFALGLANGVMGTSTIKNFENIIGTEGNDRITGDDGDNVLSGLGGVDEIFGEGGDDVLVANKGNDFVFGGYGDDLIVWNNGDGSDLFDGGEGEDTVQVNFDTDLVNDDLQNKDVAEFSTTADGVQFARIEVNDQTVNGLFALDIRDTETLETNFGDGDDTAVIVDNVLDEILLQLDGGEGVDTLDFSQADGDGVQVDLAAGTVDGSTAVNFENVIGTDFDDTITGNAADNVIAAGGGVNHVSGGDGADTFVFRVEDSALNSIRDFEEGVDQVLVETIDPGVSAQALVDAMFQLGDDVVLEVNDTVIVFEDKLVADITVDDFTVDVLQIV